MASSLGAFQFDNLVQSRIPFLFINLGVDTTATYAHIHKMHLERTLLPMDDTDMATASADDIVAAIKAFKYPNISAIVVVDQDASKSAPIAEKIEQAGFTNCFFLKGGWEQLVKEKSEGF